MNIESLRNYCLSKPGATESFPFGEDVLVFKVCNKIFALANMAQYPLSVNLKCDPERAIDLRERYPAVTPGYHMNKQHWNSVSVDGTVSGRELREWVDHSYDLVVRTLKSADRASLQDSL